MDYKVLYRKYRPRNFEEVAGQEYVVKTLKNAISNNKISHAYIFTGPRGTGKTSMAKIFAKSINCENPQNGDPCLECSPCKSFNENPDIIEIDAASNNGVDEIRELINNIKLAPSNSKYKVYIIDEVHMLSQSAFNALLLTLEEPPSHVVFILATTDIQNVPITILSRTQRFDFTRISIDDIIKKLTFVREKENINITDDAIREIAFLAEGGLRDALSILDQVASMNVDIDIDTVLNTFGTISNIKIQEFINNINQNDINKVIEQIDEFKNSSVDSKVFISKLTQCLKDKAINIKLDKEQEQRLNFDTIKSIIFELNDMLNNKMISIDPYTIIEMIILNHMGNSKITGNNENMDDLIQNNFPGNKKIKEKDPVNTISEENDHNADVNNQKKEVTITELANQQQKDNSKNPKIEEFLNVRINNCFVNANKKDKNMMDSKWNEFIQKISTVDNQLYMNIVDTKVLVCSDKYAMLGTISDSSAALINRSLESIESYFADMNQKKYKFVAISEEEWQKQKKEYINNIKNNIKYELQEEIELAITTDNEIEQITNDIFDNVKIELEKE